jgi:hypothetical protein
MDANESDKLDEIADKIFDLNGMNSSKGSFAQMGIDGDYLFIKFMSDNGVTDGENGRILHTLLEKANVRHEYFDDRKFLVKTKDIESFLNDNR